MNYYNEIDPYPAQWLRNLAAAGHIPPGTVDERSIADVRADDLVGFQQVHFFAGIGGWPYALRLAGWPDDQPVWTGSCPCQPFSTAGKGRGKNDPRHLWPQLFRLLQERRPSICFGEQVSGAAGEEWIDLVYSNMESIGYALGAAVLPAAGVGAPHGRHRIYWVACRNDIGRRADLSGMVNRYREGLAERSIQEIRRGNLRKEGGAVSTASTENTPWSPPRWIHCSDGPHRQIEPGTLPLSYGISGRMGRLQPRDRILRSLAVENHRGRIHGYGNAIVPQVGAVFVRAVMDCILQETE